MQYIAVIKVYFKVCKCCIRKYFFCELAVTGFISFEDDFEFFYCFSFII